MACAMCYAGASDMIWHKIWYGSMMHPSMFTPTAAAPSGNKKKENCEV